MQQQQRIYVEHQRQVLNVLPLLLLLLLPLLLLLLLPPAANFHHIAPVEELIVAP